MSNAAIALAKTIAFADYVSIKVNSLAYEITSTQEAAVSYSMQCSTLSSYELARNRAIPFAMTDCVRTFPRT